MQKDFVCIDLETTGLDAKKDKIIEIGAVRVRDGKMQDIMEIYVNPGRKLEERIVELTGITDADLEKAPSIEELMPDVIDFLGNDVLLGHCILFDYMFLKQAAVNQGLPFERKGMDTLKAARKYLPELESRSLSFLCEHFGIVHNAHRALEDAKATTTLYFMLEERFGDREKEIFTPTPLLYHVKKQTPITIPQKEQLYRILDRHRIEIDYDIEKMTRSEASRLISQLLVEYGR